MEYDVVVVGSGAAGYYSALSCAKKGYKVALVEKGELGGTAFRWGSLAVKRILDSFRYVDEDLLVTLGIDAREVYKKKYKEAISDLKNIETKIRKTLEENNIDIYIKELKDGVIDGISWKKLIIATGTIGVSRWKGENIITHKELMEIEELPKKICIVGGNVEGIEIANITSYLGIETCVVEGEDGILNGTARELVEPVEKNLKARGVRFKLGTRVRDIAGGKDRVVVECENGEVEEFNLAIVTGARKINIPNDLALELDNGYIKVDSRYETSIKGIYAVGDINGKMGMANVGRYQGEQMGPILAGDKGKEYPSSLSRAIYTIPEIAVSGVDTPRARSAKVYFRDTFRGFAKEIKADGFIRLSLDNEDRLEGVSIVGGEVSEYLGIVNLLVDNRATLEELSNIMMAHPTLMEAFVDCVQNLKNR